jgi:hypothetical protein
MNIPVFVSHPSALSSEQQLVMDFLMQELSFQHLEARALGQTDYPTLLPLREVLSISRHCVGGLILGFKQFETKTGIWKAGSQRESIQEEPVSFPTPWNQLEAGILYTLGLPLLIFREDGVVGGIFDMGTSDIYIHKLPTGVLKAADKEGIREVFLRWAARVRRHYYRDYEVGDK